MRYMLLQMKHLSRMIQLLMGINGRLQIMLHLYLNKNGTFLPVLGVKSEKGRNLQVLLVHGTKFIFSSTKPLYPFVGSLASATKLKIDNNIINKLLFIIFFVKLSHTENIHKFSNIKERNNNFFYLNNHLFNTRNTNKNLSK